MKKFLVDVRRLFEDRRAVTAIEYALIASLIAVLLVSALTTIGTKLSTTFLAVSHSL